MSFAVVSDTRASTLAESARFSRQVYNLDAMSVRSECARHGYTDGLADRSGTCARVHPHYSPAGHEYSRIALVDTSQDARVALQQEVRVHG